MNKPSWFTWPDMTLANFAAQTAMLAWEAQQVIALRMTKFAQGGADVPHETLLMVAEKLQAMQESGALLVKGALEGDKHLNAPEVLQLYRKKVRENHRRLS